MKKSWASLLATVGLAAALVSGCWLIDRIPPAGGGDIIRTPDEAAAAVLASNPVFTGIQRRDPNLIGQAEWYEASAVGEGWTVTVRIGWGDCPAGCISEHVWRYSVSREGTVRLVSETGDALPAEETIVPARGGITGIVTKGPMCPVMREPPDPACADKPVSGAVLIVANTAGREVARTTSGVDGRFSMVLPPGSYRLLPQPVPGLLGTAAPVDFVIAPGATTPIALNVAYDTGIR